MEGYPFSLKNPLNLYHECIYAPFLKRTPAPAITTGRSLARAVVVHAVEALPDGFAELLLAE